MLKPFLAVTLSVLLAHNAFGVTTAKDIAIILEPDASAVERAAASVLQRRLSEIAGVESEIVNERGPSHDLSILLGVVRPTGVLHDRMGGTPPKLPARKEHVFAEGYALRTVDDHTIAAVGADVRGVFYAVGELLRQFRYDEGTVTFNTIDISSSPAFRCRGFSANQGGTMMKIAKARAWAEDELHGVILEYALAGGNTFYASDEPSPIYTWMKSHDFMTVTGARPNQLYSEFPEAWKAHGREAWEGKSWVCPSIPEARAALLAQWDADFAKRADHEVMRFYAGDPGGCTCDKCTPWGKTFVLLSEEMAGIWLKYHPKSTVQIANQGLDNAGDQAILDYLNETPRAWSYGLCYGPGSNAMSPYFRDIDMRDDLFEYAGHGWVNRYVRELLRGLPANQHLVHYSDITHYISAQFAAESPEPNLVRAYGRRTFHARPVAMYNTFQAIMPFSEGDIIYSEGNHDQFHQYIWARMLWNPNRTLDDLTTEYCRFHFGAEAAPDMVQALYQLEKNLEAPLAMNEGIGRYYSFVREAGQKMPAWRMARDFRWRQHMQKAALDCYVQAKLRIEVDKESRIRALMEQAIEKGQAKDAIAQSLAILDEPAESAPMASWREEARILGEETDARHGDRNPGYFKLDQPLRDLPGLKTLLEKARDENSRNKRKTFLEETIATTKQETRKGNIFW